MPVTVRTADQLDAWMRSHGSRNAGARYMADGSYGEAERLWLGLPDSEQLRFIDLQQRRGDDVIRSGPKMSAATLRAVRDIQRAEDAGLHDFVVRGAGGQTWRELRASHPEVRDMGEASGSTGGYTVPQFFTEQLYERLKLFSPVYALCEQYGAVWRTTTGAPLPVPALDDTANSATPLPENMQITEGADPSFSLVTSAFGVWPYLTSSLRVPNTLLTDASAIGEGHEQTWGDPASWIGGILQTRISRGVAADLSAGAGSAGCQGYQTGITSALTAASASAITTANLQALRDSVDPAYAQHPSACWLMPRSTLTVCEGLYYGSGTGASYPVVNYSTGRPRIFGEPVVIDPSIPGTAATSGQPLVVFGAVPVGFLIREVVAPTLIRLSERYSDWYQTAFLMLHRIGSITVLPSAFAAITHS